MHDLLPPSFPITDGLNPTEEPTRPVDLLGGVKLLLARWWLLLAGAALGFFIAVTVLHFMTPRYTVAYKITPTSTGSNSLSSGMGGIGSLAAIAGVSIGAGKSGATSFELYIDALSSRAMAVRLAEDPEIMHAAFADQWDQRAGAWREPSDLGYSIIEGGKTIVGYPPRRWQPPAAADLQRYLERKIVVQLPGTRDPPITTISTDQFDPAFGQHLLAQLDNQADTLVRREALDRATRYSAYLAKRLPISTIAEVRSYLAGALADQEKAIMMASSGASYAALVVQPAVSSLRPTTPNYPLIAILGLVGGLFAGGVVALYRGLPDS